MILFSRRISDWEIDPSTPYFLVCTIYLQWGTIQWLLFCLILWPLVRPFQNFVLLCSMGKDGYCGPPFLWLESIVIFQRERMFKSGVLSFQTSFCKSFILCLVNPSPSTGFVLASSWKVKTPTKVKFVMWQILYQRAKHLGSGFEKGTQLDWTIV